MTWCLCVFDVPGKENEAAHLEELAGEPQFWEDPKDAQQKMQQLSKLKEQTAFWRDLESRTSALLELVNLALEESDYSLEEQLAAELQDIRRIFAEKEFELTLSGPYDSRSAILSVHAGAGGTESQDWAEMLLRMYLRWAEGRRFDTQLLDVSQGDEAGLKSATAEITGEHAYGYLKAERGVHRLVRLSPFDGNHSRHTSFALIEVLPAAEEDPEVNVRPEELKVEFYRSSGPGGQNVQKVASAVRITHLSTGIVVTCQNERSQHQNREFAMKILLARLLERQMEEKAQEVAKLKGKHVSAEWGNQIRSYVLHPYQMVKDHRTGYQTSSTQDILDGNLDEFLNAYLASTVGSQ